MAPKRNFSLRQTLRNGTKFKGGPRNVYVRPYKTFISVGQYIIITPFFLVGRIESETQLILAGYVSDVYKIISS